MLIIIHGSIFLKVRRDAMIYSHKEFQNNVLLSEDFTNQDYYSKCFRIEVT